MDHGAMQMGEAPAMSEMDHGAMPMGEAQAMPEMDHANMDQANMDQANMDHGAMQMGEAQAMPLMDHANMDHANMEMAGASASVENADGVDPLTLRGHPNVANIAEMTRSRLAEAGTGLDGNGRRVLTYADLRSISPHDDMTPPSRTIEFHLTGNMERFVWGFNGKKFSESTPIHVALGEKVRFALINNTMMEHPIHLHGFFTVLENGQGNFLPLKHTVNVKPGERLSYYFFAHTPGHWAFHCHLMYHMETGMFRTILVS
jgi:FtsP/CotA-like multicopper oxidase with cupredoxin domain